MQLNFFFLKTLYLVIHSMLNTVTQYKSQYSTNNNKYFNNSVNFHLLRNAKGLSPH